MFARVRVVCLVVVILVLLHFWLFCLIDKVACYLLLCWLAVCWLVLGFELLCCGLCWFGWVIDIVVACFNVLIVLCDLDCCLLALLWVMIGGWVVLFDSLNLGLI